MLTTLRAGTLGLAVLLAVPAPGVTGFVVSGAEANALLDQGRAADKGDNYAGFHLDVMVFFGQGGPADQTRDLALIRQAADGGHKPAKDWLAREGR